jgi:hypothetical protein
MAVSIIESFSKKYLATGIGLFIFYLALRRYGRKD